MRKLAVLLAAATAVSGLSRADAQGTPRPSFAGSWNAVDTAAAAGAAPATGAGRGAAGAGGRGTRSMGVSAMIQLGGNFSIVQDDKNLTVVRTTTIGEQRTLYNLDGTESRNPVTLFGFALEPISKVTWVGDTLRVRTYIDMMGMVFEATQTFAVDTAGVLRVESFSGGEMTPLSPIGVERYKRAPPPLQLERSVPRPKHMLR